MSHVYGRKRKRTRAEAPTYLQLVQDNTPPVAPTATAGAEARRRVVIVPLDDPTPTATLMTTTAAAIPRLAPEITAGERRKSRPGETAPGDPATRLVCPVCNAAARVDVVDLREKRLHMSCDQCFRMWQDRVRTDDVVPSGLQRLR